MRTLFLIGLLALGKPAMAAAPTRLTEPAVRDFVGRQSKAWNAGDLGRYFALFAPGATFTDQGRAKDGRVVPYGTSTLAEARAQTRRARAKSKVAETTLISRIEIAPDGRSARVVAGEQIVLTTAGRARHLCAERVQTLIATPAGLRSKGQTDTYGPCR